MKKVTILFFLLLFVATVLYISYKSFGVPFLGQQKVNEAPVSSYMECVAAGYEVSKDEAGASRCLVGDGRVFSQDDKSEGIEFVGSKNYTCNESKGLTIEASDNGFTKVVFKDGRSYVLGKSQKLPESTQYSNNDDSVVLVVPESGKNLEVYENSVLYASKCIEARP